MADERRRIIMSRLKLKETGGAITEHWMLKRMRQHKSVNDPSNVIRIPAESLLKLHELKNRLVGDNLTLFEENEIHKEKNEQVLNV